MKIELNQTDMNRIVRALTARSWMYETDGGSPEAVEDRLLACRLSTILACAKREEKNRTEEPA